MGAFIFTDSELRALLVLGKSRKIGSEEEELYYSLAQKGFVRLGLDPRDNSLEAALTPIGKELIRAELMKRGLKETWRFIKEARRVKKGH